MDLSFTKLMELTAEFIKNVNEAISEYLDPDIEEYLPENAEQLLLRLPIDNDFKLCKRPWTTTKFVENGIYTVIWLPCSEVVCKYYLEYSRALNSGKVNIDQAKIQSCVAAHDLAPPVLDEILNNNGVYILSKAPERSALEMLYMYPDPETWKSFFVATMKIFEKIHSIGIVHGAPNLQNIAVMSLDKHNNTYSLCLTNFAAACTLPGAVCGNIRKCSGFKGESESIDWNLWVQILTNIVKTLEIIKRGGDEADLNKNYSDLIVVDQDVIPVLQIETQSAINVIKNKYL